tara:strand:- start:2741 stop:4105 length:1365 start_codon:yes stop_codon:yes gene_type:complete
MINVKQIANQDWHNTKVSILGAGSSGIAAAKLCRKVGARPFISDHKNDSKLKNKLKSYEFELNGHSNKVLDSDLVIISPGINPRVPIVKKILKTKIPIVSEIEFAFWFSKLPIIAVTGSNGKSTTVNLIKKMFDCSEIKSQIGGNFGEPYSNLVLNEIKEPNLFILNILEVSSFQLEHIVHFSPNYSIILNFSPDHIDRHGSMENYIKQKMKISKNLREPGWLIFNSGDILLSNQLHDYERNIPFSQSYSDQALLSQDDSKIYINDKSKKKLIHLKDIGIKGYHNIDNVLAASTLALKYGLKLEFIKKAIKKIKSLPHRMEFIKELDGIKYYNDSKATNINSTIAAIKSFDGNIILILGGRDKGDTDYKKLFLFTISKIKLIICYGESGEKIKKILSSKFKIKFYPIFKDAVQESIKRSETGDVVLLSPSCSSYDQFNNFEHRGEYFKFLVTKL